jgi:acetyl-CoA C-acetyltransferase
VIDWTRVPVVIGAGQVTNREEDPLAAPDPFELMESAARRAAASAQPAGEARAGTVLEELSHCFMVHSLSLRHGEPARALAERIGANSAAARCSGMGGNIPQWLINRAAELVVAGGQPLVLVVGAEALATRRRAKKAGQRLDWPSAEGWPDTWPPLEPDLGIHPVERAHGLDQATTMYALIESAVAHGAGHDPTRHRAVMGSLMARFNEVAAANPMSWFPARRSAEEIMAVTADNRMIFHPYPKYVNAVMDVDMGAAVLVTDGATARRWGLGPEEVAYLSGWADLHDTWFVLERPTLHRSEALAGCAAAAFGMAGIGVDDVGAFDLYSCFPSSVEVALDGLGITADDRRPLTLTGGLPYHGGPGSNYVTHAVANSLEWLRSGAGDHALVHGTGYYLTKHAVGVYSRRPPSEVPRPATGLQDRFDAEAQPLPVQASLDGPATVVAYTVPYERDGAPGSGILLLDAEGRRTMAVADPSLTQALVSGDVVGSTVTVHAGATSQPNTARA